jgi:WS/DGAT/MGAT family acyltransferase
LASTALDPDHPLWQMHLIERYRKGSALIARFHHCYADGMALLNVFLSLTDPSQQPAASTPLPVSSTAAEPAASALGLLQDLGRGALDLASASLHALAHPEQSLTTAKQLAAAGGELAAIALLEDDPPTPLKGRLGVHKRLAWVEPVPLLEIKTIAAALGCTINDVLLSCVAGALGTHLAGRGCAVDAVTVRALVPVNLRPAAQTGVLGNYFGLVFVDLPLGERNPLTRLFAVHHHMRQCKHSEQAAATLWLLSTLGSLPAPIELRSVEFFTAKASLVISNVPGPRTALYLAGARIEQQFFWVPQAGSIGLGISLLSHAGNVHCGVMSDAQLLPEPQAIARLFREEFERLLLQVLVGPLSAGSTVPTSA